MARFMHHTNQVASKDDQQKAALPAISSGSDGDLQLGTVDHVGNLLKDCCSVAVCSSTDVHGERGLPHSQRASQVTHTLLACPP